MVSSVLGKPPSRYAKEYEPGSVQKAKKPHRFNRRLALTPISITSEMVKDSWAPDERFVNQIRTEIRRKDFMGVSQLSLDQPLRELYESLQSRAEILFQKLCETPFGWNELIEEENQDGLKVFNGLVISGRQHNQYCNVQPPRALILTHRKLEEIRNDWTADLIDCVGELRDLNISVMKSICKAYDLTGLSPYSWVESLGLNDPVTNPGLKTIFFKHPAIHRQYLKARREKSTTRIIRNSAHHHPYDLMALVAPHKVGRFVLWNKEKKAWYDLANTASNLTIFWDGILKVPHYTHSVAGKDRYLCTTFGSPKWLYQGLTSVQQAA
jgi:hypothetical protein